MHHLKLPVLASAIFLITGCELLFDSYNDEVVDAFKDVYDCATSGFDEGPIEISTPTLSSGALGVKYSQIISSEIKSEPDDNDYIYQYTYTADELPPGLSYRESNRYLYIEGVPQSKGMYPLTIEVFSPTLDALNVHRPESCKKDSLATKSYMLTIE